jgi:hypothetical protein
MKFIGSERGASCTRRCAYSMRALLTCGVLTALALALTTQTARAWYTFQDVIDQNDPTFNQELGINDYGIIAGYFGSGAQGHPNKGYTIVRRYFVNENFPDSVQTQVTGLNSLGAVLGFGNFAEFTGTTVGFWSDQNNASMVNNNFGFINVGGPKGLFLDINHPGTGLINGVKTNQLLGVNDFNVAVGFYIDKNAATHGYTYSLMRNKFSYNIDDPNGVGATTAAAINDKFEIVGFYTDSSGVTHGFFESKGAFTTIDAPNAQSTSLLGLNNFGVAVGFDIDQQGAMHGIICNVASATCEELDDPNGIGTTTFNGVNDHAQIVGFYVNGQGNTIGLLANPIPPPKAPPIAP